MITQNGNDMASYANATKQNANYRDNDLFIGIRCSRQAQSSFGTRHGYKNEFLFPKQVYKAVGRQRYDKSITCIWPMAHISSQSRRL